MKGFRGFTLVEILVSVIILGFLITGIYRVLNIGRMTYTSDLGWMDLHQNARRSTDWMVRELREGAPSAINISGGNSQITFNTPNETGIIYYFDSGNNRIMREFPTSTYRILANNISSLSFCCWRDTDSDGVDDTCDTDCSTSHLLEIQLTADKTALGRDLSLPLKVKVHLRNE